ncbi:hypothetical protein [Streptomyces goshikiensis]|uniref:hypothetical protein n=1 Tax=Streptomyces goshikiensis TaxID=1942 RepID=UPI00368291CF
MKGVSAHIVGGGREQRRLLPRVPCQDTDEAAWSHSLDVNLTAHYRTCHAVPPA